MKALLLDADGVVLKKGERFGEKFSREYSIPMAEIMPFFENEYGDCQKGQKDLKEVLPAYLKQWGWDAGVDSFLEYWFADLELNPEIAAIIAECKQKGITCYMASNNEHYRARTIESKIGNLLDGYFFSSDLKVQKKDPTYFQKVVEALGVPASEVGFVDNEEVNIEAAREAGLQAKLYTENMWSEFLPNQKPNEFKLI